MAAGRRVAHPRIALPLVEQAAVRSAPRAGVTETGRPLFLSPSPAGGEDRGAALSGAQAESKGDAPRAAMTERRATERKLRNYIVQY